MVTPPARPFFLFHFWRIITTLNKWANKSCVGFYFWGSTISKLTNITKVVTNILLEYLYISWFPRNRWWSLVRVHGHKHLYEHVNWYMLLHCNMFKSWQLINLYYYSFSVSLRILLAVDMTRSSLEGGLCLKELKRTSQDIESSFILELLFL